jgi:hypothetical protein
MLLGVDKHASILAVFLVIASSASGQTGKSYKFHVDGNLQKADVQIENQTITINYSISDISVENLTNSNGSFYRVSIPGHINSTEPGKPEVPVFSRLISLPPGSSYKIKISEVRKTKINPSSKKIEGLLYPAQEGESKDLQQEKTKFRMDRSVYSSRGQIPSDTVRIEMLGTSRGTELANLYISPVRYNPHSNTIEVFTSMKISVTFSSSIEISNKSLSAQSELFSESLSKGVLNFNPGEVIPGYSTEPVKMVIVTDTAFKKQIAPFIRWKTQKGFKVRILYRGTGLAGNDYLQLKDTLTRIYKSATATDPAPEYLLIIGDTKRIPYYGSGGTGNVTDMYYGEFDGNGDYIPEMFIGRVPAADTTEVKTALNKIIQYEKFQFADTNSFSSRALITAGYDAGYASYMNAQIKYATSNYLTPANNIQEFHFNYPQSYTSKDSVIKLINKGISFINYTGHGDAMGWLHLNIKTPDIPSFQNKNMYPFVISNACSTGQFSQATSFGNRMVLSENKGAIGYIGCSNDSYWDEDFYWAVGPGTIISDPVYGGKGLGAYDRLFHTHGESPSDWYFSMGQINYAGNMSVSASNSARKKYYWEIYNLIGDPSVIPIIGKPGKFSISLPDTLPNGITSISLSADPFSYVAVSHFDTLWDASYASASGSVTLHLPGVSNDSCLIVITGQNKKPVIKTVKISKINKEYINLTSSIIDDSQGNNNHVADYGESFHLKLGINNLGLTDSHNLYAKISSSSQWITIASDSAMIGDLKAGSGFVLSDKLSLKVSDNVPDMGIITIRLMLKDQVTEKHYSIDIYAHSPELQIVSCLVDDKQTGNGDYIPDAGETFNLIFKVRNQGTSDISGQFSVGSQQSEFTIINPDVKSGVLKFGEITTIPVLAKLSENSPSGSLVSLDALLDCSPYIVNRNFSFRVGKVRENFETSTFTVFPWINVSTVPWVITSETPYDGNLSARSGLIGNSGITSLAIRTLYAKDDSLKFWYKVSSEPNYDFLSFKLNGTEIFKKSGEIPWTSKTVPVSAGLNRMEWTYRKDNSFSQGSDCAWLDLVDFTQSSPINYIQKDLQVARIMPVAADKQYNSETVSVKVLNLGSKIIDGFNLAYIINNRYPAITQHFDNQILPYGDSVMVSFTSKADLSKYGVYKITTYGFDNNDDYLFNDTLSVNIENTQIDETVGTYPNPFNDKLTIFINSPVPDKLQISITSSAGVKLYSTERSISSGSNSFTLTDFSLIPSVYYLNIHGTSINKTIPVIKASK